MENCNCSILVWIILKRGTASNEDIFGNSYILYEDAAIQTTNSCNFSFNNFVVSGYNVEIVLRQVDRVEQQKLSIHARNHQEV